MQLTFITGLPCSGKSYRCDHHKSDNSETIVLSCGKLMRVLLGEDFFVKHGSHLANPQVENMVRSLVKESVLLAVALEKPLAVDGFPRSVDQVWWLASNLGTWLVDNSAVEIEMLDPTSKVLQARKNRRRGTNGVLTTRILTTEREKIQPIFKACEVAADYGYWRVQYYTGEESGDG